MPTINLTVKDKRAEGTAAIVCGNSDYEVLWTLDEEWASYDTKTMRVAQGDGSYQDVVFSGLTAPLPVLSVPGWVSIGLFAGDIHTSTPAVCISVGSITSAGGSPAAPTDDVYAQIMELLNSLSGVDPEDVAAAVEAYLVEHPVDVGDVVKITAQDLTEAEQAQARSNISTASQSDMTKVLSGKPGWVEFVMGNVASTGFRVLLNSGSSSPASIRLTKQDGANPQSSVVLDSDGWLTVSGRVLKLGYPSNETYNTRIQGLAAPVNLYDATHKKYVDELVKTVITSATINDAGHLLLTLADGSSVDVGEVVGQSGDTPEKGVDYFTDEDKAELVQDVLSALPTWEGGSY